MKSYMHYGYNDFIICLGYKGEMIKEYFLNYEALNNDLTITFGKKCSTRIYKKNSFDNFKVTLADTGPETMTGGRLLEVEKYIDSDDFMLTYGDGVSNIDIRKLYAFHKKHKKTGNGNRGASRFPFWRTIHKRKTPWRSFRKNSRSRKDLSTAVFLSLTGHSLNI